MTYDERTFNVLFLDPDNHEDETQFDIEDSNVEAMMNEIIVLFNHFSEENWDKPCRILMIKEVNPEK